VSAEAPPRRRRPYWTLLAFAALMLAPPAWAVAGLVATVVATGVIRGSRLLSAYRERSAARSAAEGVVLGVDGEGRSVVLSDRQLSAHGLIVGASGAGKSTTLLTILADHVRRGRPVVAIDMKGSPAFAHELACAAAAAGRPFRLWTLDGPAHWNPLGHGNPTELKDRLIGTERFTEPHYQRAAERYIQTALQVLEQAHPGRPPTLDEVVGLMDHRRMPSMLRGLAPPLTERVHDYLAALTPDQISAIRGLGTRLAIITESHTGRFLAPTTDGRSPEVDLHRALSGSEVVLLSLNSGKYGKLAAQLGTLAIQDLVSATGERLARGDAGGLPQAIVGVDEFSALGADHVMQLIARGREPGVCVVLATQELADLDRAAPGLRDQVMGTVAVKIVHRQDVPASAHTIAQVVGTVKTWEETHQTGGRMFARYDTGRGTRRQVEHFALHPNAIKELRTGEAVLITKQPAARAQTVRVGPPPRAPVAPPPRAPVAPPPRAPVRPPPRAPVAPPPRAPVAPPHGAAPVAPPRRGASVAPPQRTAHAGPPRREGPELG
jgi:conjugal transfer pilus assembly protein TraD